MGDHGDGSTRHSVNLSGGTIHYEDRGEGEPLVFVHGFGANGLLWRETADSAECQLTAASFPTGRWAPTPRR